MGSLFDGVAAALDGAVAEALGGGGSAGEGAEVVAAVVAREVEPRREALEAVRVDARALLELALRRAVDAVLRDGGDHGRVHAVWDLALASVERGLLDALAMFTLFEDVLDGQSIVACEALFAYLEGAADKLRRYSAEPTGETAAAVDGDVSSTVRRKCKLAVVRMCNDLLRRLSKTQHSAFCGRVLLYMAQMLSVTDRSGVNVTFAFNRNATAVDGAAEDGAGDEPVDFNFYRLFWALQETFANPDSLFGASINSSKAWAEIAQRVDTVLRAFEGAPVSGVQGTVFAFPKYLSSSKLIGLQVQDGVFRRHVLVQMLIYFQYITTHVPKAPAKPLGEDLVGAAKKLAARATAQLEAIPPSGEHFERCARTALERERHWIEWKTAGCNPFEKPSQELEALKMGKRAAKDDGARARRLRLRRIGPPGWTPQDDNMDGLDEADRLNVPEVDAFLAPVVEGMDPDAGIEDEFKRVNDPAYVWRASRVLLARRPAAMLDCPANGVDLEAIVRPANK